MNWYDLARALHILSVIAWMAGLLYLPRLYVYHAKHIEQTGTTAVLGVMERNLLRMIMNPAMIAAWIFGLWLIHIDVAERYGWAFFSKPWVIVKLAGVVLLTGYHHFLSARFKKFRDGKPAGSETFWRRINEVPFVLAAIMVLAVTLEFGN